MPHQTFWDRSSGRYINFSSAGELWNRSPDEVHPVTQDQEQPLEFFYVFLDIHNNGEELLATEEINLIDIIAV